MNDEDKRVGQVGYHTRIHHHPALQKCLELKTLAAMIDQFVNKNIDKDKLFIGELKSTKKKEWKNSLHSR